MNAISLKPELKTSLRQLGMLCAGFAGLLMICYAILYFANLVRATPTEAYQGLVYLLSFGQGYAGMFGAVIATRLVIELCSAKALYIIIESPYSKLRAVAHVLFYVLLSILFIEAPGKSATVTALSQEIPVTYSLSMLFIYVMLCTFVGTDANQLIMWIFDSRDEEEFFGGVGLLVVGLLIWVFTLGLLWGHLSLKYESKKFIAFSLIVSFIVGWFLTAASRSVARKA